MGVGRKSAKERQDSPDMVYQCKSDSSSCITEFRYPSLNYVIGIVNQTVSSWRLAATFVGCRLCKLKTELGHKSDFHQKTRRFKHDAFQFTTI